MKGLAVLLFSLLCALSLAMYTIFHDHLWRYVFSLLALYIGFQFFRRYEGGGMRAAFILATIVLFFLAAVVLSAYETMKLM